MSNRERALSVLGKIFCWSISVFDDFNDWIYCKVELKHYHEKFYVQTKECEREKIIKADSNNNSDEHA